jgi:hypothetical protein
MTPKVFISVGGAPTTQQAAASDMIFHALEIAGLSPRQMKKNEWSSEQPLRAIRKVMKECHGVVVIAFTRFKFPSGTEQQKDGKEEPLTNIRLPTVWNQIEASMGYTRGLPLLLIAEHGIKEEGFIEGKYDWQVYWTNFEHKDMSSKEFAGFLESWKKLVIEHEASSAEKNVTELKDPSDIPVAKLLGMLSIPQLWKLGAALLGLMISIATASFRLGAGKWPWQ